jgi:hypothetical protein
MSPLVRPLLAAFGPAASCSCQRGSRANVIKLVARNDRAGQAATIGRPTHANICGEPTALQLASTPIGDALAEKRNIRNAKNHLTAVIANAAAYLAGRGAVPRSGARYFDEAVDRAKADRRRPVKLSANQTIAVTSIGIWIRVCTAAEHRESAGRTFRRAIEKG